MGGDKQFNQVGATGGNKTESKPKPSSNGEEKEMVLEDNLVATLVEEVPTSGSGRSMTASKSGKDPRKMEPMVYVDQPREESTIGGTDVNESENNDHAEEPILVNSNPERETEKATTDKSETKETTPMKGSEIRPMVNTPKNISETSVQATKVKLSKVKF